MKVFFAKTLYYYPELLQQLVIILFTLFISNLTNRINESGFLIIINSHWWLLVMGILGLLVSWVSANHHISFRLPQTIRLINIENVDNFFKKPWENNVNIISSVLIFIGFTSIIFSLIIGSSITDNTIGKNFQNIKLNGKWNSKIQKTELIIEGISYSDINKKALLLLSSKNRITENNLEGINMIPISLTLLNKKYKIYVDVPINTERSNYYALSYLDNQKINIISDLVLPIHEDTKALPAPKLLSKNILKQDSIFFINISWEPIVSNELSSYQIQIKELGSNSFLKTINISDTVYNDIIKLEGEYLYYLNSTDIYGNISNTDSLLIKCY